MSDMSQGVTRREALKRGVVVGGAAVAWATPTAQAFAMTNNMAQGASGGAGCTPGYWKNHVDAWQQHQDPTQTLGSCFGFDGTECNAELNYFVDKTILQALFFQGGDDLMGKLEIFFRAAAAAKLNSIFLAEFPWTGSDLGNVIYDAIASCDESELVGAGNLLDTANNIGCPFSNDNPPTLN